MNSIQNSSAVLPLPKTAALLGTSLPYYYSIKCHAFALAGKWLKWNFMLHVPKDFGVTVPFLLQHLTYGIVCRLKSGPHYLLIFSHLYQISIIYFTVVITWAMSTVVEWRNTNPMIDWLIDWLIKAYFGTFRSRFGIHIVSNSPYYKKYQIFSANCLKVECLCHTILCIMNRLEIQFPHDTLAPHIE